MHKIISAFTITTLLLSSFGGFPVIASAVEGEPALSCAVQTVDVVSDITNTVEGGGSAVATYNANPFWTASIPGATWIWDTNEVADASVEHPVTFTKTFTLADGTISSAVFDIAADNGYTLTINDQVIEDKITEENNYGAAHLTHYNIAALFPALLHTGVNTIKVTVKNFAVADSNPHANPAGLLYKMSVGITPIVLQTQTLVSDTQTQVNGGNAALVSPTHLAWTALIDGASWIWSENPIADAVNETTQTFTRTFTIGGTPTDAFLDSATDNDYSITVNTHPLTFGASTFDSAQHITIPAANLVAGLNTITFTVKNLALTEGTPATNPAGLLYKVSYQTDACANSIVPVTEVPQSEKGTIQLKNVVTPTDGSGWNAGIDASYTFLATWIHDGYDSGPIDVTPGEHSVFVQTAPELDGLQYSSKLSCMDGSTEVATGGPGSLLYGDNLVSTPFNVAANQHIVCTFTHIHKGTIQLKNIVTPHDDSAWNLGIDSSYTFWKTWAHDSYDSGLIPVMPGHHTVVGQTAPTTNGLNYVSVMECKDIDTDMHVASSGPASLVYGQNLITTDFVLSSNQHVICTFTSVLHPAPNTPVLLSPADGSIKKATGLTLDWSDVIVISSPVTYVSELSLDKATTTENGFTSVLSASSTATSIFDASGLSDNTYYWHVRACDAINSCSPWSDAWKITVDSTAPVSDITSPTPDTEFLDNDGITISGITKDLHDVASTTLAFAPYNGTSCGAYTNIITLNSTTSTTSFGWTYNWIPADAGTYCVTAHGEDIAGNREASPFVTNIKYKKTAPSTPTPTPTPVTPGGGGGGSTNTSGGGNGGGGGGGNGPIAGTYGMGGDNSGGNTTPTPSPSGFSTTFLSANDSTSGGINQGTNNKLAVLYGNTEGGISGGNEPGTLTSTSSVSSGDAQDNSNQTASVIGGASWLTLQHSLWILLILLLIILAIWFFSRRKEDTQIDK